MQHLLSVRMEHIYDADMAYLDNLMPWSENLPDVCKKTPYQNAGSHTLVVAGILVKVRVIYRLQANPASLPINSNFMIE